MFKTVLMIIHIAAMGLLLSGCGSENPSRINRVSQNAAKDGGLREGGDRLKDIEGLRAANFELESWMNSEPLTLDGLKGKIVVLDFWATWCGPCISSIPKINALYRKYKAKGVVFIGVCAPRGSEQMSEVVKKHGMKYPTAIDPGSKVSKAYRVNSFPDYYLIDREGILRIADCRNSRLEEGIQTLLTRQ